MDTKIKSFLIYTEMFFKVGSFEYCRSKYLTPSKIQLIKDIGFIIINGKKYQIKEIVSSWDNEKNDIIAIIETNLI